MDESDANHGFIERRKWWGLGRPASAPPKVSGYGWGKSGDLIDSAQMLLKTITRVLGCLPMVFLSTSCVLLVGLDPAERLGNDIEANSKRLMKSDDEMLEFGFVPDPRRLSYPSNEDRSVTLEFHTATFEQKGESTLVFNRWTYTGYHNRFVSVPGDLKSTRDLCEEFIIRLRKKGDGIELYEID